MYTCTNLCMCIHMYIYIYTFTYLEPKWILALEVEFGSIQRFAVQTHKAMLNNPILSNVSLLRPGSSSSRDVSSAMLPILRPWGCLVATSFTSLPEPKPGMVLSQIPVQFCKFNPHIPVGFSPQPFFNPSTTRISSKSPQCPAKDSLVQAWPVIRSYSWHCEKRLRAWKSMVVNPKMQTVRQMTYVFLVWKKVQLNDIYIYISADPCLSQGRGGAWDHRRCAPFPVDLFSCQHQRQATQAIPTPRHQRAKTRSYSALCRCVCAAGLAMLLALRCRSRLAAGQVGSSRRAAGQHQLLEQVLALRLPALKPFHCRCQYQLQASSGWLAVGLACQGQLLAAGLAMPFKASGRPSRQFQASSRPTPGLRGGFALAFARLETLPLPLPISVPRPGPIAHSAGACAQQALRCPSRLAAGEVGSFRLAARQQAK